MDAGISIARQDRSEHRHDLRTLTYLTVDHANGGVIRNLNQNGMGVQMVAALRPGQKLHMVFELRNPRLRVETLAEVVWGTFSGQCGIRFLDLPRSMRRQINEWIFGDLLECISLHSMRPGSIFSENLFYSAAEGEPSTLEDDGLLLSGTATKVIALPVRRAVSEPARNAFPKLTTDSDDRLDWLSQPLSQRGTARLIDVLAVLAAFLLFVVVFLSVTRDAPPWPFALAAGSAVLIAIVYWGFCWVFGGESFGTRLARKAGIASPTLPEKIRKRA